MSWVCIFLIIIIVEDSFSALYFCANFFRIFRWIEIQKMQHLFEIELLCNIMNCYFWSIYCMNKKNLLAPNF